MTGPDPQAVADAVTACRSVVALSAGPMGTVATYGPGERIMGVRINATGVVIHVVGRWDTPIPALVTQIRASVSPLVGGRDVDIVVEDLAEPELAAPTEAAKS